MVIEGMQMLKDTQVMHNQTRNKQIVAGLLKLLTFINELLIEDPIMALAILEIRFIYYQA